MMNVCSLDMKFKKNTNKFLKRECISLFTLYGGYNKNQHKNFVKVPIESRGTIVVETTDNDGTVFVFVKFLIQGKTVNVKCAPAMIEIVT